MRNSTNGWTIHEAGMAQFDDIVGDVMKKLKDMGVDDNNIVILHHRQRHGDLHLA
jgi:arylsulfatase